MGKAGAVMGGLFGGGGAGSQSDKFTGGQKSANKANKNNLAFIKSLFYGGEGAPFGPLGIIGYGNQKYDEALKSIEGVGAASKADALSKEKQYVAHTTQGLQGMGLSGSTVGSAVERGIHSDTLRTLGGINEDIARMRAGLLTGQAGFQQGNINSLANIFGGVQHTGGTNYLAELMKLGTAAFL
jgi:hypothetical protein